MSGIFSNGNSTAILARLMFEVGFIKAVVIEIRNEQTRTKASAISTEARISTKGHISTVLADWKSRLALLEMAKAALPWILRLGGIAWAGWQWVLPLLQRLLSVLW